MAGYLNVDLEHYPGVDVVADLERSWPFEDGSVEAIYCNDFPEHLRQWYEEPDPLRLSTAKRLLDECYSDEKCVNWAVNAVKAIGVLITAIEVPKRTYGVFHFMNEANRVLKVGGTLTAKIPSTDGRGWAQDPTHVGFWNENTTLYFRDGFGEAGLYPSLKRGSWATHYVVTSEPNPIGVRNVTFELEKLKEEIR